MIYRKREKLAVKLLKQPEEGICELKCELLNFVSYKENHSQHNLVEKYSFMSKIDNIILDKVNKKAILMNVRLGLLLNNDS